MFSFLVTFFLIYIFFCSEWNEFVFTIQVATCYTLVIVNTSIYQMYFSFKKMMHHNLVCSKIKVPITVTKKILVSFFSVGEVLFTITKLPRSRKNIFNMHFIEIN
jgi:hypothetical protein